MGLTMSSFCATFINFPQSDIRRIFPPPYAHFSVSALTATPRIRRRKPAVPTPLSSANDKKFRTKISAFPALAAEPLRPRAATPEISPSASPFPAKKTLRRKPERF